MARLDLVAVWAALVEVRATDEVSGERVEVAGVNGDPARLPARFHLAMTAPGYRPVPPLDVLVSAIDPRPVIVPVILRPLPVRVGGVVATGLITPVPVAGALVTASAAAAGDPPLLALREPVRAAHPAGATVRAPAVPWQTTLTHRVDPGDGLLRLSAAPPGGVTEVDVDGELRTVGVISGADGSYAVEGVGGVRALRLRAGAGPAVSWLVEYGRANKVELRV
jgi:hypothetical protein